MCKKWIYATLLFSLGLVVLPVSAEDFVTVNKNGNVMERWTDGQLIWSATEGAGDATLLEIGPDGNVYASTSADQDCRMWDGETGEYLGMNIQNIGHRLYDICFGPDIDGDGIEDLYTFGGGEPVVNSYTSASGYTEQGSWIASVAGGAWVGDFGPDITGDGVQELYVLPDLAQNTSNILIVIDGATKAEHSSFAIPLVNRPGCLVAASDGRIYITGRNNDVIVSYLPDGTDPQTHVGAEGSNFSTQIAEGKAGEWYISNRVNVTGLPSDAGSVVVSTDNFATTSIAIAGTVADDYYFCIASFDSADMKEGPAKAYDPKNGEPDVLRDSVLTWTPGPYAAGHEVYFGHTLEDVNSATEPNDTKELDDTSFDPGRMKFSTEYFWRVDEVNDAHPDKVWKGDVWKFTVEPKSIAIVTAVETNASSADIDKGRGADKTVDGSGLTDGQHSADQDDMWRTLSGEAIDASIQYDFDKPYKLHQVQVWNHNSQGEEDLGYGIKDALIETSLDGEVWAELKTVTLLQAPGSTTYKGEAIALDGVTAQSIRFTAKSNYGGSRSGLSEVSFDVIPTYARDLKPATESADLPVELTLSWRAGRNADKHEVLLGVDPNTLDVLDTVSATELPVSLEMDQTYYWQVNEVNMAETPSYWEGTQSMLTTAAYIVVDDMESYKTESTEDSAEFYIWQVWKDGSEFGTNDPTNGSVVGANPTFGDYWPASDQGRGLSLAMWFDNTTVSRSEVTNMVGGQDWTKHGSQTLSLVFKGASDNTTGQIYVQINDTKILYDGAASDLTAAQWSTWHIDLSSVGGVQNVTQMMIGVEDASAKGVLYVDDIRFYPIPGETITPTPPDEASKEAHYTLDGSTDDSSANGRNGTAMGDPVYVDGPGGQGQAISLDGSGLQYVDLGTWNPSAATGQLSLSLWVKWSGLNSGYQGMIGKRDSWSASNMMWVLEGNNNTGIVQFARNGGSVVSGLAPAEGEWQHWGVAADGENATVYVNGRIANSGPYTFGTGVETALSIGCSQNGGGNPFYGAVSDVRIYSEALSDAEIASLAGLTDPIYKPF